MLTGDQRTALDLNFSLFNIPVRVSPYFWLVTVMLGYNAKPRVDLLAIWVLAVFVSILVHEFGHALTAQAFGNRPSVLLYGFGGLAFHQHLSERWQRICVILAGPVAGFILAGIVIAILVIWPPTRETPWPSPLLGELAGDLLFINIAWGLINLLPVWPLDGGQFTGEILTWVSRASGNLWTYCIGFVVALGLVIYSIADWAMGRSLPRYSLGYPPLVIPFPPPLGPFGIVMFGLLAVDNYNMAAREMSMRRRIVDDRLPWERGDY